MPAGSPITSPFWRKTYACMEVNLLGVLPSKLVTNLTSKPCSFSPGSKFSKIFSKKALNLHCEITLPQIIIKYYQMF
jgi:hypothetical protein